jgi:RNA polymerase sigma factor (sigma-70 family)
MTDQAPTVFVVDDDPGVGDSMHVLLESAGLDSETFSSAVEFLEAYDPGRPGCLVLDVRMPDMSGPELQAHLREMGSILPIIFITAHGDVPTAVEAVKAGATDFLEKPFRYQELLEKVQVALEEDARNRAALEDLSKIRTRLGSLTPREREVMELVVEGKPNKNIARALGISQRTVEIHRSRVMEKMKVRSLSMLVRSVMRATGQG